ncbi:MAG: 3-hydroxyacyl-ACP dehydratase FabZ [Burkholderiaceae bacterium]|nr:3-hydroxyacyl-ACP dehydratase FabZ [Burkholderiaceae bacterium]
MKKLDINQIKEYLPHRYPMLLVDRVLDWEADKKIVAIKNVTANEAIFNGHFPHRPVMPGVLLIEALAQTAALLTFLSVGKNLDENSIVYFAGIDNARFKRPIEPGDQFRMEAELIRNARAVWKYKVAGYVDDVLAVEAEVMCAVRTTPDSSQKAGQ